MQSLVNSIFLYACETWTLSKDLQKRIRALEMRCLRRLLNINYKDRVTNVEVRRRVTCQIGPHSELLAKVIEKKLKWFGHVIRSDTISKTILQGTVDGIRRRGRPKLQWQDNVVEWTGMDIVKEMRATMSREGLRKVIWNSTAPLRHPNAMG